MEHTEKASRLTSVDNETDIDRIILWLPECFSIDDDEIREATIDAFLRVVPEYFWVNPSSSSGKYHSVEETGEFGNVLHTKRVFAKAERIARTKLEQELISERDVDCVKSAALLHDTFKYGWPSSNNSHTVKEHDIIAAAAVLEMTDLPDEVSAAIATHMGGWGEGPNPETVVQHIIHDADMVASDKGDHSDVYMPTTELLGLGAGEKEIESKTWLERIANAGE